MIVRVASLNLGLDNLIDRNNSVLAMHYTLLDIFDIVQLRALALHSLLAGTDKALLLLALLGELFFSVVVLLLENVRFDQSYVFLYASQLLYDLLLVVLFDSAQLFL